MQLARYLVNKGKKCENPKDTPVVILENEISSAGVDNQLLSQANYTVENIFSGCVCCSSAGLMCDTVRKIEKNYNPDWLIIEATGMAYPDEIKKSLIEDNGKDAVILALVDAKKWYRTIRAMKSFVKSQLMDANVILLNKIDKVEENELPKLEESISEFNSEAILHRICAIEPLEDEFWSNLMEILDESM